MVTVGHLRVTIGHLRVTIGYIRFNLQVTSMVTGNHFYYFL